MKKQHKKPRNPRNDKNQAHGLWISYYSAGDWSYHYNIGDVFCKGQYVNAIEYGYWIDNSARKATLTFYIK